MIILLAFIRTVSISLLCLFAGFVTYALVVWTANQIGLHPSQESKAWIGLVCLVGAWASYRLFFRQAWHKAGDEWIQ